VQNARIPRAAWLQLGAAILLFGLAWPAIKLGLAEATPLWFAVARIGLCCATSFVVLALIGRLAWPSRADWPVILSVGFFQIACFFPLANLGVASARPSLIAGQASPNSRIAAPSCSQAARGIRAFCTGIP